MDLVFDEITNRTFHLVTIIVLFNHLRDCEESLQQNLRDRCEGTDIHV